MVEGSLGLLDHIIWIYRDFFPPESAQIMKDKVQFLDELIKHGHEEVGRSLVNLVSEVSLGGSKENMVNINT